MLPHQELLDLLGALGCAVERQDRGGRGHHVDDPDDGLLREGAPPGAGGGEEACARHREGQRVPVSGGALDGVAREERRGDPERGDLREGQVHEDHAAGEDVEPQVDVHAGEDEAGEKGHGEDVEHDAGARGQRGAAAASTRRRILTSKRAT
jgi:hypothetical protein